MVFHFSNFWIFFLPLFTKNFFILLQESCLLCLCILTTKKLSIPLIYISTFHFIKFNISNSLYQLFILHNSTIQINDFQRELFNIISNISTLFSAQLCLITISSFLYSLLDIYNKSNLHLLKLIIVSFKYLASYQLSGQS